MINGAEYTTTNDGYIRVNIAATDQAVILWGTMRLIDFKNPSQTNGMWTTIFVKKGMLINAYLGSNSEAEFRPFVNN